MTENYYTLDEARRAYCRATSRVTRCLCLLVGIMVLSIVGWAVLAVAEASPAPCRVFELVMLASFFGTFALAWPYGGKKNRIAALRFEEPDVRTVGSCRFESGTAWIMCADGEYVQVRGPQLFLPSGTRLHVIYSGDGAVAGLRILGY